MAWFTKARIGNGAKILNQHGEFVADVWIGTSDARGDRILLIETRDDHSIKPQKGGDK